MVVLALAFSVAAALPSYDAVLTSVKMYVVDIFTQPSSSTSPVEYQQISSDLRPSAWQVDAVPIPRAV